VPERFRVIKAYESPYPQARVFPKGSRVEVIKAYQEDPQWPNWFWCVGEDSTEAWVPGQFLQIDGKIGILKRDYNAIELSVQPGEELQIHEVINGFGWAEKQDGAKGWVPMKHLVPESTG
jgi:hypothetical protein